MSYTLSSCYNLHKPKGLPASGAHSLPTICAGCILTKTQFLYSVVKPPCLCQVILSLPCFPPRKKDRNVSAVLFDTFNVVGIIIAIIIREMRFKWKKGDALIDDNFEDFEYKEPMQEYVEDFKLKINDEVNKDIEMRNI